MNKLLRSIVTVLCSLGILASLAWAWVLYGLDCWFKPLCGISQLDINRTFFWIFLVPVPLILVVIIVIANLYKKHQ